MQKNTIVHHDKKKRKEKLRRQWKPLPTLNKEKEPLGTEYRKAPPPRKGKEKINGDQEGCRLGLKPAPDESW
jgi:hypothetical protein